MGAKWCEWIMSSRKSPKRGGHLNDRVIKQIEEMKSSLALKWLLDLNKRLNTMAYDTCVSGTRVPIANVAAGTALYQPRLEFEPAIRGMMFATDIPYAMWSESMRSEIDAAADVVEDDVKGNGSSRAVEGCGLETMQAILLAIQGAKKERKISPLYFLLCTWIHRFDAFHNAARAAISGLDLGGGGGGGVATAPTPTCSNGHLMAVTDFTGGGYIGGYNCDICSKKSSKGHLGGSTSRWCCSKCYEDLCFACKPLPRADAIYTEGPIKSDERITAKCAPGGEYWTKDPAESPGCKRCRDGLRGTVLCKKGKHSVMEAAYAACVAKFGSVTLFARCRPCPPLFFSPLFIARALWQITARSR
jgi:hypothetical protein